MNCPHCGTSNADGSRFCGSCGQATTGTEPQSFSGEAAISTPLPDLIGREIAGRYRMIAKLGEGGMGAVYRAEQISLKRTVAVKLLRPEVASSPMLLRRFNAEAEAVAKLSHPNTVGIYDFGQDTDGSLFIAMEFIEGRSLRQLVHREAPLSIRRTLHIAAQISASLVDAHARSIVHRDLKPDNVMLQERGRDKDVVRVLDFGIAKLRDEGRATQMQMTQAGDMLGTPQYMAPEQIRGEAIDGRTDVYALGCIMYEMLTGRLPFEAPTVMALLSKHLLDTVVPPSQRRPELGLPPAIDQLVLLAMAKDPAHRPPTMEALGEQIAAHLAALPAESSSHAAQSAPPASAAYPVPPSAQHTAPRAVAPSPVTVATVAPAHAHPAPAYARGPAQAPYDPPAYRAPVPDAPPAPKKSNGWLLALVGILALGGAGAGIYLGVIRKPAAPTETPAPTPTPAPDPFAVPNGPSVPDPDPNARDPFAVGPSGTTPTPPKPAPAMPSGPVRDGNKIGINNVMVTLPPGYRYLKQDTVSITATNGTHYLVVHAIPASGDPDRIASDIAQPGLAIPVGQHQAFGGMRPFYGFANQAEATGGWFALLQGPTYSAAIGMLGEGENAATSGETDEVNTLESLVELPDE